jgi:hypothetical protein
LDFVAVRSWPLAKPLADAFVLDVLGDHEDLTFPLLLLLLLLLLCPSFERLGMRLPYPVPNKSGQS